MIRKNGGGKGGLWRGIVGSKRQYTLICCCRIQSWFSSRKERKREKDAESGDIKTKGMGLSTNWRRRRRLTTTSPKRRGYWKYTPYPRLPLLVRWILTKYSQGQRTLTLRVHRRRVVVSPSLQSSCVWGTRESKRHVSAVTVAIRADMIATTTI